MSSVCRRGRPLRHPPRNRRNTRFTVLPRGLAGLLRGLSEISYAHLVHTLVVFVLAERLMPQVGMPRFWSRVETRV